MTLIYGVVARAKRFLFCTVLNPTLNTFFPTSRKALLRKVL